MKQRKGQGSELAHDCRETHRHQMARLMKRRKGERSECAYSEGRSRLLCANHWNHPEWKDRRGDGERDVRDWQQRNPLRQTHKSRDSVSETGGSQRLDGPSTLEELRQGQS